MTEQETSAAQRLFAAQAEIENWRKTRTKLGPMPAALWAEAISLARELGVSKVAASLAMSYGELSKRVDPSKVSLRKAPAKTALSEFVEVAQTTLARPSAQPSTVIELTSATGDRLTMRLNQNVDIGVLVAKFQARS